MCRQTDAPAILLIPREPVLMSQAGGVAGSRKRDQRDPNARGLAPIQHNQSTKDKMKNQLLVPIAFSLTMVSACDESWQNAFVAAANNSSVMQYNNQPDYSSIYATYDDDYADASSSSSSYDSSPSQSSGFTPPPSANTPRSSNSDLGPILVEKQHDFDNDYERRLAESKRAFAEQQAKREADAEAKRIRDEQIVQQRNAERAARCRANPGSIDCPGVR